MIFKNAIINDAVVFNVNDNELIPLTQTGETILLNSPTARCLQLLLENQGCVVSREDFLEQVWGAKGIVVSQNTFYQNISLLRKSLKKAGLHEDIVVTVKRKGFTLSSDVVIKVSDRSNATGDYSLVNQSFPLASNDAGTNNQPTSRSRGVNLRCVPQWVAFLVAFLFIIEVMFFFFFIYN